MKEKHDAIISIITVCHKSSVSVREYISSFIKEHRHLDDKSFCEFIFVENSGDDEIEASISALIDIGFSVSIIYCENHGFGAGCNLGATKAKGDLLAFVNPDMIFKSSILPVISGGSRGGWGTVKQLARSKRISSIDWLPENKGLLFEIVRGHIWVNLCPSLFLKNSYASGAFLIVDKKLFFTVGCFNEEFFMYYEEAELCRRLYGHSGKMFIENRVVVSHEGFGSQSSSVEILRNETEGLITYCKVTNQHRLIRKKLSIYKVLGIWSGFSKMKYSVLKKAITSHDRP